MIKKQNIFIVAACAMGNATAGDSSSFSKVDEMTGKSIHYVVTPSKNLLQLKWPYGTVGAKLVIRKSQQDGINVMVNVDKGQIPCRSYSPCSVLVRFNEKQPKKYSASGAADGSTNVIFINNENSFLSELKSAKTTRIQAMFYQDGNQTMEFDTEGIDLSSIVSSQKSAQKKESAQKTESKPSIDQPTLKLSPPSSLSFAKAKNCLVCHDIDKKIVGPAYKDVAKRYANKENAEEALTNKVLNGGKGVWGPVPMPPNNAVTPEEARSLVKWVLSL